MDVGLLFGMIVAIFLISLILIYGYEQIDSMRRIQEQAEMYKAIEGLKTAVDRVYSLSGETSEKYKLAFPSGITKVCFMPSYRGETVSMRESKLRTDLPKVIDATWQEKQQLTRLLIEMRFAQGVNLYQKTDRNLTVLLFFQAGVIPDWKYIPHLEPSKKTGASKEIFCAAPRSEVWLKRSFDRTGAWVDVDES